MTINNSATSKTDSQSKDKKCAILGIGNPLLGDEGIGVHIVENLQEKYRFFPEVALINGGCGGLNLYFILERYDPIIIIDALTPDTGVPGSILIIDNEMLTGQPSEGCSAHSVGLQDALLMLQALTTPPDDLVLIGVVPAVLEYNLGLSSTIEQQLPSVETTVLQQLRLRNIEVLEQ